jgi:LuxR family transcriptional regulator, maltose regulon positive regulatory protein
MVVLQSLLSPPPAPKYEIHRKAVGRSVRWLQSQPAAIVGVLAPAGYGKTSYLRQIHLEMKAVGHSVAWLSLRDVELDANTLIAHLSAALRASGIGIDLEIERISSPSLAVMQLQSAIEQSGKTITLLLDDVDVLKPRLANIIERLFSPELGIFRVAFSARKTPLVRLGNTNPFTKTSCSSASRICMNFSASGL